MGRADVRGTRQMRTRRKRSGMAMALGIGALAVSSAIAQSPAASGAQVLLSSGGPASFQGQAQEEIVREIEDVYKRQVLHLQAPPVEERTMDSGYYAALTGLVARTQALDIASTNLANAQTPGYRAEQEYFRSVLLGPGSEDSQLGRTVNNYGLLGGDRISLGQGALEQTGNPLDLAIEGEGFFQVQTPNGLRYTRDGGFHRTPSGRLVTACLLYTSRCV